MLAGLRRFTKKFTFPNLSVSSSTMPTSPSISLITNLLTFLYPVIIRLPLHMSKPSLSIMSYNLKHCINFHTTQQLIRCRSTPQRNTTHPPHHHCFHSLQTLYVFHLIIDIIRTYCYLTTSYWSCCTFSWLQMG